MAEKKVDPKLVAAVNAFANEWDVLKAAPEHKEFIANDYLCRFEPGRSELWEADTKRPGFKVCFAVLDGEYEGRRLYHDLWLASDDPQLKGMAKRDLQKLGFQPRDLLNPPNIDAKFLVTVKVNKSGSYVHKFVLAS